MPYRFRTPIIDDMNTSDVLRVVTVRRRCQAGEAKRIRQAVGLSLGEVASPVGVDQATISRWERGERAPRGLAAVRYADLLDQLAALVPVSA